MGAVSDSIPLSYALYMKAKARKEVTAITTKMRARNGETANDDWRKNPGTSAPTPLNVRMYTVVLYGPICEVTPLERKSDTPKEKASKRPRRMGMKFNIFT